MPLPHRPTLDLSLLHDFLVLAELRGFGRAAERLAITQSALSRRIQRLEADVGATLVQREPPPCTLTPAGQRLKAGAEQLLALEADLLGALRAAKAEPSGTLRLGCVALLSMRLMPPLLAALKQRFPQVEVALVDAAPGEQWRALREGRLDAGLMGPLPATAAAELDLHEVQQLNLVVALPARHPLTARRRLRLAHLAGLPMLAVDPQQSPRYAEWLLERFAAAGVLPGRLQSVDRAQTLLHAVAAQLGVAVLPAPLAAAGQPGVAWRPLIDLDEPYRVTLGWRRGKSSRLLDALLEELRRVTARVGRVQRAGRTPALDGQK
jgi:DNA-binding transcriptional LysR family regulator